MFGFTDFIRRLLGRTPMPAPELESRPGRPPLPALPSDPLARRWARQQARQVRAGCVFTNPRSGRL